MRLFAAWITLIADCIDPLLWITAQSPSDPNVNGKLSIYVVPEVDVVSVPGTIRTQK